MASAGKSTPPNPNPQASTEIRRVLLVQHAGAPGGSVMSGRYLIEGLGERGIKTIVMLAEPSCRVRQMYQRVGAEVYDAPNVPLFRHTTAGWARLGAPRACAYQLRAILKYRRGIREVQRVIRDTQPDVVHLNSVTLALIARGLAAAAVPIVWHVRESPTQGYLGLRTRFLRETLRSCPGEVIFLSKSDQKGWVNEKCGTVIPNVVRCVEPTSDDLADVHRRYNLSMGDRIVVYLGGLEGIKGIDTLIAAVLEVRKRYPSLKVLAPGTWLQTPISWKARLAAAVLPRVGLARSHEIAWKRVQQTPLNTVFCPSPFVTEVIPTIAAAEFLVFPSIRPHFARPVVEAATIGVPSVGSNLGGVRDLIVDKTTGLLVEPGNPQALANAMIWMLEHPSECQGMGRAAAGIARARFSPQKQMDDILSAYRRAKSRWSAHGKCL